MRSTVRKGEGSSRGHAGRGWGIWRGGTVVRKLLSSRRGCDEKLEERSVRGQGKNGERQGGRSPKDKWVLVGEWSGRSPSSLGTWTWDSAGISEGQWATKSCCCGGGGDVPF